MNPQVIKKPVKPETRVSKMRFPWQRRRELVDALPDVVVELFCEFLVGVEIFTLSHVNRSFYRQLSGDDVWARRVFSVSPPSAPDDAVMERCWQKRAYTRSKVLLSLPWRRPRDGVSFYIFGTMIVQNTPPPWGATYWTIDVWFCVLYEDESPVDVVCSITGHHTVSVVPGRWYHLAWDRFERVYFNGKRIATNATSAAYEYRYCGEFRSNFFGVPCTGTAAWPFRG